jgi:hypothetical protein
MTGKLHKLASCPDGDEESDVKSGNMIALITANMNTHQCCAPVGVSADMGHRRPLQTRLPRRLPRTLPHPTRRRHPAAAETARTAGSTFAIGHPRFVQPGAFVAAGSIDAAAARIARRSVDDVERAPLAAANGRGRIAAAATKMWRRRPTRPGTAARCAPMTFQYE